MTPTFEIKIYDDELLNRQQLIDFLTSCDPNVNIRLYIHEGASLYQCGVIDIIVESGLAHNITINTGNEVEPVAPATRHHRHGSTCKLTGSNFWSYAHDVVKHYKYKRIPLNTHHRLACLIGRKNLDRLAIMYWLQKQPFNCLLSSSHDPNLQYIARPDVSLWVDNEYAFQEWIKNFNIKSIDDCSRDKFYQHHPQEVGQGFHYHQYSALSFYHAFDVELIAETFVRGPVYFPTEKTIRPIMGAKPFLIYGPKYYLTHLKHNGFRTFDSCWDESYDKYEGAERWIRIREVITQIHAWSDVEWAKTMQRAQKIADYNKKNFHDNNNN